MKVNCKYIGIYIYRQVITDKTFFMKFAYLRVLIYSKVTSNALIKTTFCGHSTKKLRHQKKNWHNAIQCTLIRHYIYVGTFS